VAMEDFDNGGPAVKAACLVCTGPPDLGSRAAAVNVEITNVVRPIVGDADFAEGGNKSEARSVLRGGAPSFSRHELGLAISACPTQSFLLSCAGQGTLEIITSRGGLLTLRAHPSFSFLAPSASLTVPSCKQSSSLPLFAAVASRRRACLALPVPGCLLRALTSGRTDAGGWEHAALSRRPDHRIRCDGGRTAAVQRGVCGQADVPVWH
jgi:hypothetical protein